MRVDLATKPKSRARRAAFAAAAAIALCAPALVASSAPALAQAKPTNLADLVDSVAAAVVNISATQTVDDKSAQDVPDLPKGTPFDDMFDQFFKNHGFNAVPRPHKMSSLGSGFVIDPSGIVITNNHVIGDANDIVVIFTDGRKLKATIVGKDPKVDVAVLKVESDKPFKTVKFGDSDKARVGDGVMAVGNPFGLGETVTAGILSARNRNIDSGPYDDFLQTDASINKGNSGGPLFNLQGEVIGINTAILSPSGGSIGIGFATPSASVVPVIDQLEKFHETRRGWLGVRIQPVDDAIADSLGLGTARGALVAGVDEKGPAKPAGLQPGDVIVKFDGKDVKESRDLPRLVASMPVGQTGRRRHRAQGPGDHQDGDARPARGRREGGGRERRGDRRRRRQVGDADRARPRTRADRRRRAQELQAQGQRQGRGDRLRRARLERQRQGPQARRGDRGSEPAGGRDALRRRQGDRRAEDGRQEVGAAAGRQRKRRRPLRRAVARLRRRPQPPSPVREKGGTRARGP